ncbi:flagellar motor switch protein FliM [Sulfitobacter geojensis]|uniref:flagellar motor switch protein FliM n=1 Tax=Sulfitobacter geojensis TaxID=1342299 RepID=UPI00046AEE87|nr:flagellar motor switch protein FliM [Sulfitobacter geojensis]KHA50233.1 Flagellar motor switch protein FliM [Sulfitobacter geojensis]NYI27375.1 flagellar motor switch protein FliM [Sulfitobacter geojensis]OAN97729.1 flagellar motor switch protein FliM [Sulfitobacter geojensis]
MNEVLSQNEVEDGNVSLVDEIIRQSDFTFDRLPMLDIIGARLVENLAEAFSDLTRTSCEASMVSLDYITMDQVAADVPTPVLMAVGIGKPFDGEILIAIDKVTLLATSELMLGGSAKNLDVDGVESFTAIELGFGERVAAAVLAELQRALTVVSGSALELERVETDPEAAAVAKHNSLCARIKVSVAIAGHQGAVDVIIPYDALEPIRPDLGKVYFGDRGDGQSSWHDMIGSQIERAHMTLEVLLAEEAIPIQQIMAWKPGDTINFGIEEGQDATMICADTPMFKVSIGKRNNGFVAVQITEELKLKKELETDGDDN